MIAYLIICQEDGLYEEDGEDGLYEEEQIQNVVKVLLHTNSYTQSYIWHLVIFDSKTLTKLLIASQSFDGIVEVCMSLWLCIFQQGTITLAFGNRLRF